MQSSQSSSPWGSGGSGKYVGGSTVGVGPTIWSVDPPKDDAKTKIKERVVEIWSNKDRSMQLVALNRKDSGVVFCVDVENNEQLKMEHPDFPPEERTTKFVVEQIGKWKGTPFFSLRVQGSNRFLTCEMYGDFPREKLRGILYNVPQILPELVPRILQYLVDDDTEEYDEGPGYHIWPVMAHPTNNPCGTPNALQVFRICTNDYYNVDIQCPLGAVGLMTFWYSYLKCLWWSNIAGQSPYEELHKDEQWHLVDEDGCYVQGDMAEKGRKAENARRLKHKAFFY